MTRSAPLVTGLLVGLLALTARAETVFVHADRDTTLIEDQNGALSNGAGPAFFVGRTNQATGSLRRGLVRFDVASALPRHALVESVMLHLTALPGNAGSSPIALHRVLADWGEGASFSVGGHGSPAEPGEATWIHTFYATCFWTHAGGQFVRTASATFVVDGPGAYLVTNGAKMVADVNLWNAAPLRNLGWILIGDETRPQNVLPFASRQSPDPAVVPVLEIEYRLPGRRPAPRFGRG